MRTSVSSLRQMPCILIFLDLCLCLCDTLCFFMNKQANFKTIPCLFNTPNTMTSLSLYKIYQIRLIVHSKLFVHKKAECINVIQLYLGPVLINWITILILSEFRKRCHYLNQIVNILIHLFTEVIGWLIKMVRVVDMIRVIEVFRVV